ncbi:hypothetical protein LLS47_22005 [Rouxiella badensis]|uniref:hypothetical protein n=1 Tax=Yersiniaceae TaxID=1903411 RepID=UPI001C25E429|nr:MULTISPECIES: hypothetical protein [Yersiniaceae]MBU9811164.1 hypothetical protein [Rahnella perminowiae]MBU9865998.1 hypothetical protein [Rahnella aceris]MCC3735604.1 hypothetical protein [Rouxiella badensis]MCC3760942.1 hypothetical protein [Rouxiella badensis]
MFALMFNTRARMQEVLDLQRCDVRLEAPPQVRLHGKRSKVRRCPLWPAMVKGAADALLSSLEALQ